ncbi:sensor histidine kinase [Ideonella sp. 4Y16]|uniref:histidine kinase n=1 Tax=Ideonella alba TaxID=2824118 RepID=A0A940YCY9_9BURK|nr:sensor histidine kinase [Ideonella alba]MBQ0933298.1 sensor histidine kinase [Ideonella alba]MBQ0943598.1 sensor histidine kinase [Ideonella alba]
MNGLRHLARLPGARSLHRQLLLWLLLPQVVLWLAAAGFTYKLAGHYVQEAIDASLVQASRALARQIKPTATGLYIDFPRSAQEILEADPSDRVLYAVSSPPGQFLIGTPNLPVPDIPEPRLGEPYHYDSLLPDPARTEAAPEPVRMVALYLPFAAEGASDGMMLVQVGRSRANREELARRILVDTALPLSALVVLMTLIVWAGIRAGLQPLDQLQQRVQGQTANDLAPIEIEAAPPEVRSLARAINTLLAEVQHSVAAQKRFISDAAHQLRTPLAGLKSQTELALREATDPALQARLTRVHESAARSAHLVNQLLTLARAEPESASRQDRAVLDLARLARELTAEWVPRALAAGVDLGYDEPEPAPPPEDTQVEGIALLLREALHNLIDNAVRYAGAGRVVTVRVRQGGGQVCMEVEDDGPGLSEPDRERMFERFTRARHDGSGCGLGLAIVREIVERHAGQVRLLPASPRGLLARACLPQVAGGGPARVSPERS